jgi:tRNA(fMet)-specific endonuclease VapC
VALKLCLDTSAYSHLRWGSPAAVEAISSASRVLVPAVVLGELRFGFRLGRRRERNEKELREFLAQPVVRVLDVDDAASQLWAEIAADLKTRGRPLPTNDIWIAALAAREGAPVLTYDADFAQIHRIGAQILVDA